MCVHIYSFLLLLVVSIQGSSKYLVSLALFRLLQLFHQTEIRYLPFRMSVAVQLFSWKRRI